MARYDNNETKKLLDGKEVDLAIWISSFSEKKIIINKKIKNVLIGIPSHPQKNNVDIFIPVGTPGLDHNSHLLRVDKVVSMPLKKIRNISVLLKQLEKNCHMRVFFLDIKILMILELQVPLLPFVPFGI